MLPGVSVPSRSMRFSSSTNTMLNNNQQNGYKQMNPQNIVRKMSVGLLHTYKKINDAYYAEKRLRMQKQGKRLSNFGYDDEDGNYVVQPGEEVGSRYVVQRELGKGSFGVVVQAHDTERGKQVALKIIRNKKEFINQAYIEIGILSHLKELDPEDNAHVIRLIDTLWWKDHLCIVSELLSYSLYDLLKLKRFNGVSLRLVRDFTIQLLQALQFLSDPKVDIIHCDLKPENVLLVEKGQSKIKVIDFGSSCYSTKRMYSYIQSRFYRSPEVMLGLSYTQKIDMWSLGCLAVELFTGVPLFDGKDECDQMSKIMSVMGHPPQHMVMNSSKANMFFGGRNYTEYPRQSLRDIIMKAAFRNPNTDNSTLSAYEPFIDFIEQLLQYDPLQRLDSSTALQHPFIVNQPSATPPPRMPMFNPPVQLPPFQSPPTDYRPHNLPHPSHTHPMHHQPQSQPQQQIQSIPQQQQHSQQPQQPQQVHHHPHPQQQPQSQPPLQQQVPHPMQEQQHQQQQFHPQMPQQQPQQQKQQHIPFTPPQNPSYQSHSYGHPYSNQQQLHSQTQPHFQNQQQFSIQPQVQQYQLLPPQQQQQQQHNLGFTSNHTNTQFATSPQQQSVLPFRQSMSGPEPPPQPQPQPQPQPPPQPQLQQPQLQPQSASGLHNFSQQQQTTQQQSTYGNSPNYQHYQHPHGFV